MQLSQGQRQYLRKLAHDLRPAVHVGKNGLTDTVIAEVAQALELHELIKVKLLDPGDERKQLAELLAESSDSSLIYLIGNTVILYREQPDPDRRTLILPA